MATKEKVKKKKTKSASQVIPLQDKNPPVTVSKAEDDNIVDTTLQGEGEKTVPVTYTKGKKQKKRDKSQDQEETKEKGSKESDNDSVKEKPSSRPVTPSSRPASAGSLPGSRPGTAGSTTSQKVRRSPSPFGRNVVAPEEGGSNMGSLLSVKSATSVREAWSDRSETGSPFGEKQRPSSAKSTSTVVSRIDKNGRQTEEDALSVRTMDGPEQNAYIPYVYARKTIAHIMEDMKNMKSNHIRIVHDIDERYKAIEDETQTQFNAFVLCLREQYSGKVKTFRQVIEVHRIELSKKESYWNELLRSLTERNNRLLKDKKVLLIKNKVEIDRLEKEKIEVTEHYTQMVDKANATAASAGKEYEQQLAELKTENSTLTTEMETLKQQITEHETSSSLVPVVAATASVVGASAVVAQGNIMKSEAQTQTDAEVRQTLVVGGAAVAGDTGVQEEERKHMDSERQEMTSERRKMEEERETNDDQRKSWLAQIEKLQAELTESSKERAEWQGKYEILKQQAGDAETVHKKYTILESQYTALAAVVAATEESKTAAEANSKQTLEEKEMMAAEKARLEAEIQKFEAGFKKKNGHLPTEQEKSDSAKEMYTQLEEVDTMVSSLDKKIETLEHVKSGTVPPTPEVPPAPSTLKDPVVTTVEVKVPDPTVVAALEKAQEELSALQTELTDIHQEKTELHEQMTALNFELSDSKGQVTELQRLLAESSKPDTDVVAAATLLQSEEKVTGLTTQLAEKDDELERLRRENREMQKDMKKMIRRHDKLQTKLKRLEGLEGATALLQAVVATAHEVLKTVPDAAKEVDTRLHSEEEDLKKLKETQNQNQKSLDAWTNKYKKKHKKEPTAEDRDSEGASLYAAVEDSTLEVEESGRRHQALTLLQTGVVVVKELQQQRPSSAAKSPRDADVEQEMSALDGKVIDLESEKEVLQQDKKHLENIKKDLENQLQQLQVQLTQQASLPATDVPSEDVSEAMSALQKEVDALNASLQTEKLAHDKTREELEDSRNQVGGINEELAGERADLDAKIDKYKKLMDAKLNTKEEELATLKQRNEQLEADRLANVPVDTAKEIKNLQNKISHLQKDKGNNDATVAGLEAQLTEAQNKLKLANKNLETQRAAKRDTEGKLKAARTEKDQAVRELTNQLEKKELQRATLEKKVKQLQSQVPVKQAAVYGAPAPGKHGGVQDKGLKDQLMSMKRENTELNTRIKQLETETRKGGRGDGDSAADKNLIKRHEKILKELEKKYEIEKSRTEKLTESLKGKEEEAKELGKTCSKQEIELRRLQDEMAALGVAAKEGVEAATKVRAMEKDFKRLQEENKVLTENFNSERVLRKKYYNMVEDMKGKIRVYCRARPLSSTETGRGNFSVLKSPDEYSIEVTSQRGLKEFQFDQIFMEGSTQEKIFEDTNNLIQSAFDGYNVCIFAYGQTGSGKTFTMIGDRDQKFPGIAPRAFDRIFDLADENKSKMSVKVCCYMMELYNEKLIDLFGRPGQDDDRLDIKKDKKGMVFVQGAVVKDASNNKELFALFEEGSKNRHTASTKMNAESSRSHLVIGIVIESTNMVTGQVLKGKLSLVDLAGSERVAKTQASAEQLKEAMSINKSLSALGDVISALSSEQSFIPYRNNKLTMLMQDSLGGNAKTLMFVNISPADYNTDETIISLTYASRVKLITNDASKNADNKEIARLKGIIQKLKKGEAVEEEEQ